MTTTTGTPAEVPRLNANEDQVLVVRVHVDEGHAVAEGDIMLEVETTKATAEVAAPVAGIVAGLAVREGQFIDVGAPFCRLIDGAGASAPQGPDPADQEGPLKITCKARKRAAELGVDLDRLPWSGGRVGFKDIEALASASDRNAGPAEAERSVRRAVVFGGGGHAAVVLDALTGQGYQIVGCVDDNAQTNGSEVLYGVRVLGDRTLLPSLQTDQVRFAFIGVGGATSNQARCEIFELLRQLGFRLPALIHDRAHVSASSAIGAGTIVLPGAVIGPRCHIGSNVIINQGAQVCHDVMVGDGCHVTPGALIGGGCRVGTCSTVGMGAAVLFGTSIGRACLIHNNATVNTDVPDRCEVFRDGRRDPFAA